MNYVGIDISKLSFDVAIEEKGRYQHYKFDNNAEGFKQLQKLLCNESSWCVMEASGPYYLKLATYLEDEGIAVSVINPLVIRRFCQMRLIKAKTDKKDAAMIAEYGKTEKPGIWKAEAGYIQQLRQMQAYLEQLDKARTGFIRQLEAFKQNPFLSKDVKLGIERSIRFIEAQISDTEQKMEAIVESHHQHLHKQLQSIPGIGKKTSMMLIVVSGAFSKFNNAKQLSSYVGLSPRIFESGTSVKGKVRICKMGMSRVRAMLYVCSWSAIKYNSSCKNMYDRMVAKGKPKMVALIAVANKLLKQCFAMASKDTFYEKNYLPKACF
ncbi:MAG TPA: IS110 family transposase [Chitinophagales bacterium]|nr:IS110 family transposase [Chitinophagales bacterium]